MYLCIHIIYICMCIYMGFPPGSAVKKKIPLQCRRCEFNPWVRKIPWRRKWQPTSELLPGKSHGQRRLAGYSPWGSQNSQPQLSDYTTTTNRYWGRIYYFGCLTRWRKRGVRMSLVTRRLIIPLINKGDIKRRKLGKENCELSFRICKKIFFIIFYSEII